MLGKLGEIVGAFLAITLFICVIAVNIALLKGAWLLITWVF